MSDQLSDLSNDEIKRKNSARVIIIIICAVISAAAVLFFGYYKWQQSRILLSAPLGYTVACDETESLGDASRDWFFSLIAERQQDYIKWTDRIDTYILKSVQILENAERQIVQIDFSFKPRTPRSGTFSDWGTVDQGNDTIECQWVVMFDVSTAAHGTVAYKASNIERPAAYDLEQYNVSGQKEKDEYQQEFMADMPYDPAQYTYKIENKVCSVSYDGGNSWIDTPLPVDRLDYYVDGHFKYNELKPGSYVISPEKTAILYGGFNSPLACLYSDDMGKTWNTSEILGAPVYIHNKFLSFPSVRNGYIIAGSDKTMSFEAETILKTTDGGLTWENTGRGPRDRLMRSAGFVDGKTGFICYPYTEGAESMVYRTDDGGETWEPVHFEMKAEFIPFFTSPEAPVLQDGKLILLIDEGDDSDFEGPQTMQLQYVSDDMGKTWTYVQMLELETDQPG
jgi:hypothetical protein